MAANETLYNSYHAWRSEPSLIDPEFRKNFPPQSKRDHDMCKVVDVLHFAEIGKYAMPFADCYIDPRQGGI